MEKTILEQAPTSLPYRILPWTSQVIRKDTILVSGYFGTWCFLNSKEFETLKKGSIEEPALFSKLSDGGILITKENARSTISAYRSMNWNLFLKPSLHMINVTNTCNYRCRYCHAGVSQGKDLMTKEVAAKALNFIFRSSGHALTIEFQGGECLLNWKVVKYIVEKARAINKVLKRDLHICIVSNLSLLNEEKLDFLTDNEVSVCTSLDGSQEVHDANRKTAGGQDTFAKTMEKIQFAQDYYKKRGSLRRVDILATITKQALAHPKDIVDTYVNRGIKGLHLRPVQNLGDALENWQALAYTAEEFYEFWVRSMEYITELNRQGVDIIERGAYNILCKILVQKDPMYVEYMNPTGMGRSSLLYQFNGDVYNSDEGRMISEPLFRIGTVDQDAKEVLQGATNRTTWLASILELSCYNSAFKHWGGIHPVHIYQNQGTVIPNAPNYFIFKIYSMQCHYLFQKIAEDGFEKQMYLKWTERVIK